ncbi:MAG: DAK2 domain-containing protein [Clostridia bacterium]|nr:DAK2 domain-containing protein [Clostridia bacterium]
MSVRRINGLDLEQMLRNGLANLGNHEDEVNLLNVFPVPDGDTGTNMRLTLQHGIKETKSCEHAGDYLKGLSSGMLLGARGNSGVILSQFFKGFYQELSRCQVIGPGELRNGLIIGYRIAYKSVMKPVEGTILSVAREGIEHIRTQIGRNTCIDSILAMYVAEMRKTLALTPEMLSVLKEAGVVDSGAYGFILIFEGMLKHLRGEYIKPGTEEKKTEARPSADLSLFNENSKFIDGYCTEFILQLMNDDNYNQNFRLKDFISVLEKRGDSLVCVQDGKRVKVHIHTKTPANIIAYAQTFGEFLTFKMDNMQVQHNERDTIIARKHKPVSVISVVNGEGMAELFRQLGCDAVIDGGTTMNTSSKEFVEAFERLDADAIVILPNNKNVVLAAEQAAKLEKKKRVVVIPTESYAEGYFALAMDIQDSSDVERRISQMRRGREGVVTLCETTASRDYSFHEISCRKGDEIVLKNGEMTSVDTDWRSALLSAFRFVDDIGDRETCVVFRGSGVPEADEGELVDMISAEYPMMDVTFIDGGQMIYKWVIGLI